VARKRSRNWVPKTTVFTELRPPLYCIRLRNEPARYTVGVLLLREAGATATAGSMSRNEPPSCTAHCVDPEPVTCTATRVSQRVLSNTGGPAWTGELQCRPNHGRIRTTLML
jgi:hypothetical protein